MEVSQHITSLNIRTFKDVRVPITSHNIFLCIQFLSGNFPCRSWIRCLYFLHWTRSVILLLIYCASVRFVLVSPPSSVQSRDVCSLIFKVQKEAVTERSCDCSVGVMFSPLSISWLVCWFISLSAGWHKKLLNRGPLNLDGGCVLAQNRPHYLLVWIQDKGRNVNSWGINAWRYALYSWFVVWPLRHLEVNTFIKNVVFFNVLFYFQWQFLLTEYSVYGLL